MRHVLSSLMVTAMLAGCAAYPGAAPIGATLLVKPVIGYRTLAVPVAYGSDAIDHLVIQAFTLSGNPTVETAATNTSGSPLKVDVAAADLGNTVALSGLRLNTPYRLRAFAYKAPGEAAADLISTTDSDSYVDLSVTSTDPTATTLKVRLVDMPFDAQTSSGGILVTPGTLRPVANN